VSVPGIAAACAVGRAQPTDPISYGECVLAEAKSLAKSSATVTIELISQPGAEQALADRHVTLDARPESYVLVPVPGATLVVGRDPVGAMYGAMDVAERLTIHGASALPLTGVTTEAPTVALRAANPFLVLQLDNEPSWWFLDSSFWETYLDMMARARLDYLDLHGMYNFDNANFPNVLLWFSNSASFPSIGVDPADRSLYLAMLIQIVAAAAVRGIRVGLTNYDTHTSPLLNGVGPTLSADDLTTYTREATQFLVSRVPGLAYFGSRVGESGQPASWFENTVIAGIQAADSGCGFTTRTWLTPKTELLPLAALTGPETVVEVKYNGEQFGPPYVVTGGRTTMWQAYFYDDYLAPPTPYRFVFQLRAGGTHRIFRFSNYERAQRAVLAAGMSPRVYGLSFEAAHAYSPQRDFYHLFPADSFSPWTFRRDELYYLLMGRLSYDPTTPVEIFRAALSERVGTDGLWDAMQAASEIVPSIESTFTCGPDQNMDAPELELGGQVAYWTTATHSRPPAYGCRSNDVSDFGHGPFDSFAVAAPLDAATDLVAGQGTSRLSTVDVALTLLADAQAARAASQVAIDETNPEARDVVRECVALADLGEWFAHKLRAATALAVYQETGDSAWLDTATSETQAALAAYATLAADTSYIAPFYDRERMQQLGLTLFHWREQIPRLFLDSTSIDLVQAVTEVLPPEFSGKLPPPSTWLNTPRAPGPGLEALTVTPTDPGASDWTVHVTLGGSPSPGSKVNVLYRPFDSTAGDWVSVAATGAGKTWQASIPGTHDGLMYAVEIEGAPGSSYRYPDVTVETPYRALAP
jgi:hypothetical protein